MNDCERLVRDFCSLMQLPDAEGIGRGAPLNVAGVTCSVTYSRHDEANALVLYCEFGAVPAGREKEIYEELLVQNYIGAPDGGAMFGFSPLAKNVICVQHLRVAGVSAQRLADILHHMAEKAQEWRRTYFFNSAERQPERPGVASARTVLGVGRGLGAARRPG